MKRSTLPDELSNIHQINTEIWPPHGAQLVWNPMGEGRLRIVTGPVATPQPPIPPFSTGGYHEIFLLFDQILLIRQQATGCPTCQQLLQLGLGSSELATSYSDAINRLTCRDYLSATSVDWLDALRPILKLLPPRAYLLSLNELVRRQLVLRFSDN